MIFNLKDLKHLELMALLDSAEPKLIKNAAPLKMQLLPVVKDTLDSKILALCTRLRAQSFTKQAAALEQRFLQFKTSSTALYDLSGETGEQLIDGAHPEGDVEMVEAADELGVVETILSRHKKIVDMVQGKSLGKQASPNEEAVALSKEVASQFDYIADYLKRQFLNNMPEGSELEPAGRNFYGLAGGWAETATAIANKLKGSVSDTPMQMVKTILGEHPFSSSYAPITNTAEDVRRLVQYVLNWFEDNRPKVKTAGLVRYVEKCRKVLAQDVPVESATPEEGELTDDSSEKTKYLNKWYFTYIDNSISLIDQIINENVLDDITHYYSANENEKANTGWLKLKETGSHLIGLKNNLNGLAKLSFSANNSRQIKANLSSLIDLIDKADKIPSDRKTKYTNQARRIISKIDIPLNRTNKSDVINTSTPKTLREVTVVGDPNNIDTRIANSIDKIRSYQSLITADLKFSTKKIPMNNWLEGRIKLYTDQLNGWNSVPQIEKENALVKILSNINLLDKQIQDFHDKYIK